MKTSARNCFFGKVAQIKAGAVNDEVELELDTGAVITAIVTRESSKNLGLAVGTKSFALIKSSFVIVATEMDNVKVSTRNCLAGTVSKVNVGAVNSEVTIDLGHGSAIVAMITNESCQNLGLKAGVSATALFKASSVILGVEA